MARTVYVLELNSELGSEPRYYRTEKAAISGGHAAVRRYGWRAFPTVYRVLPGWKREEVWHGDPLHPERERIPLDVIYGMRKEA